MRAADHLGAVVGERLLGVERAGLAGQALDEDAGVLVDEDGHAVGLLSRGLLGCRGRRQCARR